jgi:hypothetical protein
LALNGMLLAIILCHSREQSSFTSQKKCRMDTGTRELSFAYSAAPFYLARSRGSLRASNQTTTYANHCSLLFCDKKLISAGVFICQ